MKLHIHTYTHACVRTCECVYVFLFFFARLRALCMYVCFRAVHMCVCFPSFFLRHSRAVVRVIPFVFFFFLCPGAVACLRAVCVCTCAPVRAAVFMLQALCFQLWLCLGRNCFFCSGRHHAAQVEPCCKLVLVIIYLKGNLHCFLLDLHIFAASCFIANLKFRRFK